MIAEVGITWELRHGWPFPAWSMTLLASLVVTVVIGMLVREAISVRHKFVLGTIRVSAVGLVLLMFGGWELAKFETDLPDLLLMFDESQSMRLPAGESVRSVDVSRLEAAKQLLSLDSEVFRKLDQRYRVKVIAVGENLRLIGDDKEPLSKLMPTSNASRLGECLVAAAENQTGRSTASIVLFSDGIVTDGMSLSSAATRLAGKNILLWSVGLGGQQDPPEVAIDEVVVDERAFLGDDVRVRMLVRGNSPTQQEVDVDLKDRDSGALLGSARFDIGPVMSRSTIDVVFPAEQAGRLNLEVVARPVAGEAILENNSQRMSIVVRDDQMSVLLIGQKPSYEFRFLKHLFERATGQGRAARNLFDLTSVLQDGDPRYAEQDRTASTLPPLKPSELESLDVVVFCDANLSQLGELFLVQIEEMVRINGLGIVVIAGPENVESLTDSLGTLLPFETIAGPDSVSTTGRWRDLRRTRMGANVAALQLPGVIGWDDISGIQWLATVGSLKASGQVLMVVDSRAAEPVLISQMAGAGEVWVQLTDESFRWQHAVASQNIHELYWLQLIRQLARHKQDDFRDLPRLAVAGRRFEENANIAISLKLPDGMQCNKAVVRISGSNETDLLETLYPSADPTLLKGGVDDLAAGQFTVEAIDFGNEQKAVPISFEVYSEAKEFHVTRAQFSELEQASEITGGKFLSYSEAADSLPSLIPEGRRIKIRELPPRPIWNSSLVAVLFVGLLSVEWILRRRWGLP